MDTLRVGLIGCGVIGRTHARAALAGEGLELVAVADLIPDRGRAYAEEFGQPRVYVEGDDLIDQADLDLIVLALPACGRTSLAKHAFARGRHVLTEKPVAMNVGEVEELIAARGGLKAACCSSRFRFLASAQAVTEFLASGQLGELRVVRCRAIVPAGPPREGEPPDWRLKRHLNGGGILMNWGCYDLDYLLGLTGWTLRPRTVLAQWWPVTEQFSYYATPNSDAETHFAALAQCDGGTVLQYERGECVSSHGEGEWAFLGSRGALHISHMTTGQGKQVVFDQGVGGTGVESRVIWSGDEDGAPVTNGPLQDLAAAIREDREPKTSLEKALLVQRLSDAIYASASQGQAVVLP